MYCIYVNLNLFCVLSYEHFIIAYFNTNAYYKVHFKIQLLTICFVFVSQCLTICFANSGECANWDVWLA